MKIGSYAFGRMEINGETVKDDLMVVGDEIKRGWRRKEGHKLYSADLKWIVERDPSFLIIGKGKSGLMSVPEDTRSYLEEKNIRFRALGTEEAVRIFNEKNAEESAGKVAGAFHLTC